MLRDSLVLPGLSRTCATNLRQGRRDVGLFEIGRVFEPPGREALPREERRLAFLLAGDAGPRHWSERDAAATSSTAKGLSSCWPRAWGSRRRR